MKPTLINCGNGCENCDGFGIMTLYGGPENTLIAPCVMCSPWENLGVLMKKREAAEKSLALAQVRREIAEHNERMKGL